MKNRKIKIIQGSIISLIFSLFAFVPSVSAHVIVTPKQVSVAQTQVFTLSVPTEKESATVRVTLQIPLGVVNVIPNVKPGWTINTVKNGNTITEIDWTGGTIPPEQRDEFVFQAQVPAKETTLKWKAYQMFQDGSTTAWVHSPTSNPDDDSAPPPYSQTRVINDLTGSGTTQLNNSITSNISSKETLPLWFSMIAIALSAAALSISLRRK